MDHKEGRGQPGAPKNREQGRGQKENKEHQPLPDHSEIQGGPADLNVSNASIADSELPKGPKDKSPVKDTLKRRRRGGAACTGILVYGEDECPGTPKNKRPVKHPRRRRGGGAL
jgi:hypothetical protein